MKKIKKYSYGVMKGPNHSIRYVDMLDKRNSIIEYYSVNYNTFHREHTNPINYDKIIDIKISYETFKASPELSTVLIQNQYDKEKNV